MSYFAPDFLVTPLLRQARRFSGNNAASQQVESEANVQSPGGSTVLNDGLVATENGPSVSSPRQEAAMEVTDTLSGRPIVTSPMEEDDVPLGQPTNVRPLSLGSLSISNTIAANIQRSVAQSVPSLRTDVLMIDGDMSDNPSFYQEGRFRNDSAMSSPMRPSRQGTLNGRGVSADSRHSNEGSGGGTAHRNSALPEDDGMQEMRRKIVAIQTSDADPAVKARLMHQLLTEEYRSTHNQPEKPIRIPSPASFVSQERASTPGSLGSFGFWQSGEGAMGRSDAPALNTFHLTPEDLRPTFAPYVQPAPKDGFEETHSPTIEDLTDREPVLGCEHYKRNVKLQCSTCNCWYTCRFCHDEVEDHSLIRKDTKNMLCMLCGCAQKAGEVCADCGVRAAWYYCNVCKLWDDDVTKSIYHCDDCGICRIGAGLGKDYMHCKICGVCILISKEHKCIERASDCDCPICGEYLFNSPHTVVFMKCGHTIHQKCYRELMKTSYKCPLCSQSVVNMESQFRNLDRAIDSQPMPPDFQDTRAMVSCNDCYAKSIVKYHWLGLKCAVCDSYNTAQLQIMSDAEARQQIPGPSEEDIIPGPRADLFIEHLHHQQAVGAARERERERVRNNPGPGPARVRRHSHGHLGNSHLNTQSRFNPYPPPPLRIGRSVSPVRGLGFQEMELDVTPMFEGLPAFIGDTRVDEDEEDDIDFWGGESRRASALIDAVDMDIDDDGEEEDSSDESAMEDEDDEDDGDEVDRMDLFGHR